MNMANHSSYALEPPYLALALRLRCRRSSGGLSDGGGVALALRRRLRERLSDCLCLACNVGGEPGASRGAPM